MFDFQLVEYSGHDEVYQVVEGSYSVVPAWHCWQDNGARQVRLFHVFQMHQRQWGFARHQDQLATFFEVYLGRPLNQVVAAAMSNCAEGAPGAREDNHAGGQAGAAGDRGHEIGM